MKANKFKLFICTILYAAMIISISAFPTQALAVSSGTTIDMADTNPNQNIATGWTYSGGVYYISGDISGAAITIIGAPSGTITRRIEITGTRTVILDGTRFTTSSGPAITLNSNANVTLVLKGTNNLTTTNADSAGIRTTGATLTIQDWQNSGGSLSVTGGGYGAGIGGNKGADGASGRPGTNGAAGGAGGTVIIKSGTVTARSAFGAGIGGGRGGNGGNGTNYNGVAGGSGGNGGSGGTVTIESGTVTAESTYGAGIGGGLAGNGGTGGMGSSGSAGGIGGIGGTGGSGGTGTTVDIIDGNVTVISFYGAGIGGGGGGTGGAGGTGGTHVGKETDTGQSGGNGGTGGDGGNGGAITIKGGTVTAKSTYGAGIGGGTANSGGMGGKVGSGDNVGSNKAGDNGNAGTGGTGAAVTIAGGKIIAESTDGAGIGGGMGGQGSPGRNGSSGATGSQGGTGGQGGQGGQKIEISGGEVNATSTNSAGIGGGRGGTGGTGGAGGNGSPQRGSGKEGEPAVPNGNGGRGGTGGAGGSFGGSIIISGASETDFGGIVTARSANGRAIDNGGGGAGGAGGAPGTGGPGGLVGSVGTVGVTDATIPTVSVNTPLGYTYWTNSANTDPGGTGNWYKPPGQGSAEGTAFANGAYRFVKIKTFTNQDVVDAEKVALTWETIRGQNAEQNKVTLGLGLTKVGEAYGSAITWTSANSAVINPNTGVVTQPDYEDAAVKLTATISKGSARATKEFTVTVLNKWDAEVEKVPNYKSWYEGHETAEVFYIENAAQLAWLAKLVNGGNSFKDKTVMLTSTFSVGSIPFKPIGTKGSPFQGTFDGQECVVSLNFGEINPKGLFGYIGEYGGIMNIGVTDMAIKSGENSGGIAAVNEGIIANCYVFALEFNSVNSGGLVGENYGTIENCYFLGKISGSGSTEIVGKNSGVVKSAYYTTGVEGSAINIYDGGQLVDVDALLKALNSYISDNKRPELCYWKIETDAENSDQYKYPVFGNFDYSKYLMLTRDSHKVIVWDNERKALAGAVVSIVGDNESAATDTSGVARITAEGFHKIRVEAAGYLITEARYALNNDNVQNIFLEKDNSGDDPYITMAMNSNTHTDIRCSAPVVFGRLSGDMLDLEVAGNWKSPNNSQPANGRYVLFQSAGASIISEDGIFSFAPGQVFEAGKSVWLKMEAGAIESAPVLLNIKIFPSVTELDRNLATITALPGFNATPDKSGDLMGNAASMFPSAIKLPITLLLTQVGDDSVIKNDGTIVIRGVIGKGGTYIYMGPRTITDNNGNRVAAYGKNVAEYDELWDEFKNDFEMARRDLTKGDALALMKEKYGILNKSMDIVSGLVKAEFGAVGYFEVRYNIYGEQQTSTGGVILLGGGQANYSQQFAIGPVPVYISLGGGVNIYGDIALALGLGYEGVTYDAEATFGVAPYVFAEAGAGIRGVASVGVRGTLNLNIMVKAQVGGDLSGAGAKLGSIGRFGAYGDVRLRLLFWTWRWEFARYERDLWNTFDTPMIPLPSGIWGLDDEWALVDKGLQLASRDYLRHTTAWNGGSDRGAPLTGSSGGSFSATLQSSVLPDTLPLLAKAGDRDVLIFLADDGGAAGDHLRLMYAVRESAGWSEPAYVSQIATAEFSVKTLSVEDDLYLIWQKSKVSLAGEIEDAEIEDAEESLAKTFSSIEICVAKWDKASLSFSEQKYLTDGDTFKLNPILAADGDRVSALWTEVLEGDPRGYIRYSEGGDLYQEDGLYAVVGSTLIDGVWSEPQTLFTTTDYISDLAAGYAGGELKVAYSTVGAIGDTEQPDIWFRHGDTTTPISHTQQDAGLQFAAGGFYWQENGLIYRFDATDYSIEALSAADMPISPSFQVLNNGAKQAIVWAEPIIKTSLEEEPYLEGYQIKGSIRYWDKEQGAYAYSAPLTLETIDECLAYFDAALTEDGDWQFVMNTYTAAEAMPGGFAEEDRHSLFYAQVEPKTDVALTYAYAYPSEMAGGMQPLNLLIANQGETAITELTITLNGATHTEPVDLAPGATIILKQQVDLRGLIASQGLLQAKINCAGDADPANNSYEIALGLVDVVMEASQYTLEGKPFLTVKLTNNSPIDADATLLVYEAKVTEKTDEQGEIIGTKLEIIEDNPLDSIAFTVKDGENIIVYYDPDELKAGVETLYIKAETQGDANEFNNEALVPIYRESQAQAPQDPVAEFKWIAAAGIEIQGGDKEYIRDANGEVIGQNKPRLTATVLPVAASNTEVVWHSSDQQIVHVDMEGNLTLVGPGAALITATTKDGGHSDSITVTVKNSYYQFTLADAIGGKVLANGLSPAKLAATQGLALAGGGQVELRAIPYAPGYKFSGWLSSNGGQFADPSSPATTFTMPEADTEVSAVFEFVAQNKPGQIAVSGAILYQDSPRSAKIQLYNSAENLIASADTTESGAYALSVPTPPAGERYTLVITKPGYLSYTIKNLIFTEGEAIETVDFHQMGGDINGDGYVNSEDLVCLISEFGRAPVNFEYADIDGDGLVNSVDLTILLAGFSRWDVVVDKAIND